VRRAAASGSAGTARRFATLAAGLLTGVLGAAIAAAALPPSALDAHGQLADPALEARYEHLTQQLRCLVCQNETIADSNAELAAELRTEVKQLLVAGKTDAEIYAFMKARYGEFVLYDPPVDAKTVFIWGAPFALLLVGAGVIFRVVRARSRMPLDEEPKAGPT
jgi:cytochrome c-type biogenesis protein CcmH